MGKFLDFKFYKENYLALLALVVSVIFIKIFNLSSIEENSFLENMQLIALLCGTKGISGISLLKMKCTISLKVLYVCSPKDFLLPNTQRRSLSGFWNTLLKLHLMKKMWSLTRLWVLVQPGLHPWKIIENL